MEGSRVEEVEVVEVVEEVEMDPPFHIEVVAAAVDPLSRQVGGPGGAAAAAAAVDSSS